MPKHIFGSACCNRKRIEEAVMTEKKVVLANNLAIPSFADRSTRRQAIARGAIALGGLAIASVGAWAALQQAMAEIPQTGTDDKSIALHQEVDFKAAPGRIYDALLDAKQFSAFSGAAAEIHREIGRAHV